jgi:hypothetical protein
MPAAQKVFSGFRSGRLTAVYEAAERWGYMRVFMCQCECGEACFVRAALLTNGSTKSCGCLNREMFRKRFTTHGMRRHRIYSIWGHMRHRCQNPNSSKYPIYGGRGIKVCERWQTFENFLADMGLPPTKKHSLDRIDVNGNYEPGNCRWATDKEQGNNRRDNRLIPFNGATRTLAEWAEVTGLERFTISNRLDNLHWSVEKSLTTPVRAGGHNKKASALIDARFKGARQKMHAQT